MVSGKYGSIGKRCGPCVPQVPLNGGKVYTASILAWQSLLEWLYSQSGDG